MFSAFIFPVLLASTGAVVSPLATTTTLTVSPLGSGAAQNLITLTASVSDGNGPVLHGAVTFYDFGQAVGVSQLVSTGSAGFTAGTAILRVRFVLPGNHNLIAGFSGTGTDASSTSLPQEFEPAGSNGGYATATSLAYNGITNGVYSLTANVVAANPEGESNETGYSLGSITFTDTTTNTVLGTSQTVVPNAPDASLLTSPTLLAGLCPQLIAAGDFNNDGYPDAVTASAGSDGSCTAGGGVLATLLNNADGTFTAAAPAAGLESPTQMVAGDFNGDGNLDVAVSQSSSAAPQVLVFLGNGDGTFQTPLEITLSAGFEPGALAVADFNHDGILDLAAVSIIASTHKCTLMILPGYGDGTFGTPIVTNYTYYGPTQSSQDSAPWVSMAVGYLNGDGNLDVVIAMGSMIGVFAGNGDGTFQSPRLFSVGSFSASGGVTYAEVATGVSIFQDRGNPAWGGNNGAELYVASRGDDPPASSPPLTPRVVQFTFSNAPGEPFSKFGPNQYVTLLPTAAGLPAPVPASIVATDQYAVMSYGSAAQLISFEAGYVSVGATPGYVGGQMAQADFRGDGEAGFLVAAQNGVDLVEPAIPATATLKLSSWPGWGSQQVTATFTPAASLSLLPSTSTPITIQFSALTLTSNMPSSLGAIVGQDVQITATLASPVNGNAPTGSVQFYDAGAAIGTAAPVASQAAVYSSTAFSVGAHSITAVYSGDSNYPSETSAALAFTIISQGTLALTIGGVPSSAVVGAPFTITPRFVQTPQVLSANPTGTVNLSVNGHAFATGVPTQVMTINTLTSPLPSGVDSLVLSYPGNSSWGAVTSPPVTVNVSQATPQFTGVGSSATSQVNAGAAFSVSTQLVGLEAAPAPTGPVTLLDNGNATSQTFTLTGNLPITVNVQANTASNPLAAGAHVLSFSYPGNPEWASASSTTMNVTVATVAPSLALSAGLAGYASAVAGTPVTFTATGSGGIGTPTGTVQFYVDGTPTGSPVTMANGVAAYSTSALGVGQHSITTQYSGNSYYSSANSSSSITVVAQGADTVALNGVSASSAALGSAITVSGTLTPGSLGPAAAGTVELVDQGNGGVVLGSANLSGNWPATFQFTVNSASQPLAAGAHSLGLVYSGSAQWAAGTSAAATAVTVTQGPTVTTVSASAASAGSGNSVTFTASIAGGLGNLAPTGAVQFYDGAIALGSQVVVAGGTAAYSTASLATGTHTIGAQYSGDANYAGSTGATPVTVSIISLTLPSQNPTVSVVSGGAATMTLGVNGAAEASAATTFTCSGLPEGAACSFDPQTVTGTGSTTLVITTAPGATAGLAAVTPGPRSGGGLLAVCGLGLLWPMAWRRRWRGLLALVLIPLMLAGLGMVQGCGGRADGVSAEATPAGMYTLTVTATTVSAGATITQHALVYLEVGMGR